MDILRIGDGRMQTRPDDEVGSKAANLARMAALGLPVPPAFVVPIDFAPPVIQNVALPWGMTPTAATPVHAGEYLMVTVAGVGDPALMQISLGGVPHAVIYVAASTTGPDAYIFWIEVSSAVTPGDAVPLTASTGHRVSQPVGVAVQ